MTYFFGCSVGPSCISVGRNACPSIHPFVYWAEALAPVSTHGTHTCPSISANTHGQDDYSRSQQWTVSPFLFISIFLDYRRKPEHPLTQSWIFLQLSDSCNCAAIIMVYNTGLTRFAAFCYCDTSRRFLFQHGALQFTLII